MFKFVRVKKVMNILFFITSEHVEMIENIVNIKMEFAENTFPQ